MAIGKPMHWFCPESRLDPEILTYPVFYVPYAREVSASSAAALTRTRRPVSPLPRLLTVSDMFSEADHRQSGNGKADAT